MSANEADERHRTCLTPPHDSVSGRTGGFGLTGGEASDPNADDGGAVDPNPPGPQSGGTVETDGLDGGSDDE